MLLAAIGAAMVLPAIWIAATSHEGGGGLARDAATEQRPFFRSAAFTALFIFLFALVAQPAVYRHFGRPLREIVSDLQVDRLNKQDAAVLSRGYYENLTRVDRFNSRLWEVYNKQPDDVAANPNEKIDRPTTDFVARELRPSLATVHRGAAFHTNRWGMRDKEYDLKAAPGTCRIALLGSSYEIGTGVSDDQTFESILENRLNRTLATAHGNHYEILNFAMERFSVLEKLRVLETKALPFDPDIVFYAAHVTDFRRTIDFFTERVVTGSAIPYDYLKQVIAAAGLEGARDPIVTKRVLKPYAGSIISWAYRRVVELCRERSIRPVFVLLPSLGQAEPAEEAEHLRLAHEAGFEIINASDLFLGEDTQSIRVAEWDVHPNALAHQLIADRLYKELRANEQLLQKMR